MSDAQSNWLDEFIDDVAEMRKMQRLFFKTRRRNILDACKVVEAKVDAAIASLRDQQQQLFDRSDK